MHSSAHYLALMFFEQKQEMNNTSYNNTLFQQQNQSQTNFGELVCKQGDISTAVYFVVRGGIEAYLFDEPGMNPIPKPKPITIR